MKKYQTYKPSGVEWIGEIPEHWLMKRVSNFGVFFKGSGIKKEEVKVDGFPCIRYGEIYTKYNRVVYETVSFIDEETSKNSVLIKKGAVLFTGSGETLEDIGKTIVYYGERDVFVGGDIIVLQLNKGLNPLFISYLMNTNFVQHQKTLFGRGEIIVHIYSKNIKEIVIPLPLLSEQNKIVQFLDEKTGLIDKLISTKELKIDLLKQKRTSLISQFITKGLDPNVKMKDSGIEWIGVIPKHWEIKPLKYISQITLGKMLTPEDKGEYFLKPYLRSQNIQIDNVDVSNIKEMWFSKNELEKYRLGKDDILVNEGGDVGRSSMWNNEIAECYIQNSVNRVRITNGNNNYYLFHFFLHHASGYFNSIVNRVSIPHLTKEKLENVVFLIPPISEQNKIVDHLDKQTKEIDDLISLEQKKIDLLKEYRQSLISEVITGKIDVRNN